MANSTATPRRSTISSFGSFQPQTRATSTKPGQCTHLTMTRLYTTDFQCQICFCQGSFGWIYRCTQDRELLIENDMDIGREEKLDTLCDTFPKSNGPKKRSAAARSSKLSLLDEISDELLGAYTTAQLRELLQQRGHLIDLLAKSDIAGFQADKSLPNPLIDNSAAPFKSPSKPQTKPWLPLKECQFKCCHTCRPTLGDRSYLSLDGILNGDIPATAVTGFGFHLQKRRPVALVDHVKNLGLRPPQPPRPQSPVHTIPDLLRRKDKLPKAALGLGILTNKPEPDINRPAPQDSFSLDDASSISGASISTVIAHDPSTQRGFQEVTKLSQLQSSSQTHIYRPLPLIPLSCPPNTEEDIYVASQTALPEQTNAEINLIEIPLTPLEESGKDDGAFGWMPLSVSGGVAVTEEAVEMHVADIVTQF